MSSPSSDKEKGAGGDIVKVGKQTAAKQRIEQYYQQLTKGCGKSDCHNEYCASCPTFIFQDLDCNAAAGRAVQLVRQHAPLCSNRSSPTKKGHIHTDEKNQVVGKDEKTAVPPGPAQLTAAAADSCQPSQHTQLSISEGLTEEQVMETIEICRQTGSWSELNHVLGVFFNPDCLMRSFHMRPIESSKEQLRSAECDKDIDEQESTHSLSGSRHNSRYAACSAAATSYPPSPKDPVCLDIASVRRVFAALYSIPDEPFEQTLVNAIFHLARLLESDLRSVCALVRNRDYVNLYLIVMEIPVLDSPAFLEAAMPQFCKTVGMLPVTVMARLCHVWSTFSRDELVQLVGRVQQMITIRVISTDWSSTQRLVHDDECIIGAVKLLKMLYYASSLGGHWETELTSEATTGLMQEMRESEVMDELEQLIMEHAFGRSYSHGMRPEPKERHSARPVDVDPLGRALDIELTKCLQPLVDPEAFVNEALSDVIEMDKDFLNYILVLEGKTQFAFMFHPFVLTTAAKQVAIYFDNRIRMMNERRSAIFQRIILSDNITPYLRLRIRRDHIVEDALVNLEMVSSDYPQDLKKQLFVEFEGEQGIDEGGPSKEFFQLIVEELFNPDIGMFIFSEETQTFWFNSSSFETDAQFQLIGIVLGLAIYNSIILDVHFPMVVYRKLMGKHGTFQDLKTSHPMLARSLQEMLEYEGDVAEAFMQPFCIGDVDCFGNPRVHILKEKGDQIMVTNKTRQEFILLYSDFLLNKSIEKQFTAFRRGFRMVTSDSPLELLFRPEEIELLVCGSKHYDFQDLENSTEYDGGYTADSPVIRYFWEIVHELTAEQKRQLLQFSTGSDRVPIGGLSKLKLVIARNGSDTDRCPTAHTCFNVLLLPEYASKDKLKDRLLKAITYSKGFGML